MKLSYTFFTVLFLAIISATQAQIRKGSVWLGGSIEYGKQESERPGTDAKSKTNRVGIGPAVGFALKDNLVVGLQLRYFNRKDDNTGSPYKYKENLYTGAVFLRKYWDLNSKFYAFAHTELGYSRRVAKTDFNNGTSTQLYDRTRSWSVSASVTPGIAYSVSRKVQLESTFIPVVRVNYNKFKMEQTAFTPKETNGSDFNVNGGFETGQYFTLGIRFLLSK